MSTGTAKPMPTEPLPPEPVAICELMPITRPAASSSGPPELPGLIEASVWMTLEIWKPLGASIWRCLAETMPVVTVRERPNGLPIAIVGSPTFTSLGVAERERLEAVHLRRVDLQHREVGGGVAAADLGVDAVALLVEAHRDAVGALDHVGVGDDRALACRPRSPSRWRCPGSSSPKGDSLSRWTPRASMNTTPLPSSR